MTEPVEPLPVDVEVARLKADLAAVQNELAATRADLAATRGELAAEQGIREAFQHKVDRLESDASRMRRRLNIREPRTDRPTGEPRPDVIPLTTRPAPEPAPPSPTRRLRLLDVRDRSARSDPA